MIDFHERLKDDVAAYALDTLDDEQGRSRVEAHLGECDDCRRLLEEYRAVVEMLPRALPAEAPAPATRERLFARVEEESGPRFVARPAALAARLADDEDAVPAAMAMPAAAAASPRIAAVPTPARGRLAQFMDRARRHRPLLAGLGAAAAVVVLAVGVVATQSGRSHKPQVQRASTTQQVPANRGPVEGSSALPSVDVSPTSGGSFQSYVFSGSGFPPGEVVDVSFVTPGGSLIPWRSPAGSSTVTADASGRFAVSFTPGTTLSAGTVGPWKARFIGRRTVEQDVGFSVLR